MGCIVDHGTMKPEPERTCPLREFPALNNIASQCTEIGMFAYHSKWIPTFSEKIRQLTQNKDFPLPPAALNAFENLKKD